MLYWEQIPRLEQMPPEEQMPSGEHMTPGEQMTPNDIEGMNAQEQILGNINLGNRSDRSYSEGIRRVF